LIQDGTVHDTGRKREYRRRTRQRRRPHPPPVILFVFLIGGVVIDSAWMRGELAESSSMALGLAGFLAAAVIAAKSVPRHKKEGSNIEPWKPTTRIFSDGIYARSRNPIYVAMILAYGAIAIAADSGAAMVLLLPFVLAIRYYVIAREERYLGRKFGEEYHEYVRNVRRWF
jgi:protein-S-isoprenylcysteine O-methyltransferase Ste14